MKTVNARNSAIAVAPSRAVHLKIKRFQLFSEDNDVTIQRFLFNDSFASTYYFRDYLLVWFSA